MKSSYNGEISLIYCVLNVQHADLLVLVCLEDVVTLTD